MYPFPYSGRGWPRKLQWPTSFEELGRRNIYVSLQGHSGAGGHERHSYRSASDPCTSGAWGVQAFFLVPLEPWVIKSVWELIFLIVVLRTSSEMSPLSRTVVVSEMRMKRGPASANAIP